VPDDWPAVTSTLTFAACVVDLDDAVLRLMPEDPRLQVSVLRVCWMWDSQRQQRAAVTSVTANLHSSCGRNLYPTKVNLSMTRIMPLRPGLRVQSNPLSRRCDKISTRARNARRGLERPPPGPPSVENCSRSSLRRG